MSLRVLSADTRASSALPSPTQHLPFQKLPGTLVSDVAGQAHWSGVFEGTDHPPLPAGKDPGMISGRKIRVGPTLHVHTSNQKKWEGRFVCLLRNTTSGGEEVKGVYHKILDY